MRKVKSGTRSKKRENAAAKSVDDYIAGIPEAARGTFNRMRAIIRSTVPPDSTEVISYGIPAFKRDKVLLWYAAFAKHCSLFPTGAVIEEFKNELKGYTISKGTIQFPLDKPLPTVLVKKIVKARVAQAKPKKQIATKNSR